MITSTGWTWEYIDNFMTLPRYNQLVSYWNDFAPTHIIAGAYAGNKKVPQLTISVRDDTGDREAMAGAFEMLAASVPITLVRIPKGGRTASGIPVDEI